MRENKNRKIRKISTISLIVILFSCLCTSRYHPDRNLLDTSNRQTISIAYTCGVFSASNLFLNSVSLLFTPGSAFAQNNKCSGKTCSASSQTKTNNPSKKQSTSEKICSSITNILNNEIDKTKNKTKLGILQGGLKYTNEICGKGGTPDLTKVTEGLPEQDRLRITQKTNAVLFDGVDPNLTDKVPANISKTLPSLTGKTGNISDLKSYDPTLPAAKTNPVPELKTGFQSNPKTTSSDDENYNQACLQALKLACGCDWQGVCSKEALQCVERRKSECLIVQKCAKPCYCGLYSNEPKCSLADCIELCVKEGHGCPPGYILTPERTCKKEEKPGILGKIKNWIIGIYHKIKGDKKCGGVWYDPDKKCCEDEMIFKKCNGKCIPPSEFAVFMNYECPISAPADSYCKNYNIYFRNSQHLDLAGVLANEELLNKRPVDSRPMCVVEEPILEFKSLEKGPNGLFGITDTLGFVGFTTTVSCAYKKDQIVSVNGCVVQTNVLTFEADADGARRISRSDEANE